MISILLLQWQKLLRFPYIVLLMVVLTLICIFVFGFQISSKVAIPVYTDGSIAEDQQGQWLEKLNQSDTFTFYWTEQAIVRQRIVDGEVPLAVQLLASEYVLVRVVDSAHQYALDTHLAALYQEELQLQHAQQQVGREQFRQDVESSLAEPVTHLTLTMPGGREATFHNAGNLHLLFGMTLFFVINTITLSTVAILQEKQARTWDRLILSPLRKWQMYAGHLAYSFMIGYIQIILIFLLFQYMFGIDMQDQFGTVLVITACYVFAIAALGVLLAGIIKTPEQYYAIAPNIAVGIALLGGAYWSMEAIGNPVLTAISKAMPISYAIEALNGAVISHLSVLDLAQPLSILLLFGVLCMGIGINLMERR